MGARDSGLFTGLVDQLADLLLGAVVERPERAVGGPVGRDRVLGQPTAVHVAEQVVLWAGLLVDVAQVDARADCFYRHPNRVPDVRCSATAHSAARRWG